VRAELLESDLLVSQIGLRGKGLGGGLGHGDSPLVQSKVGFYLTVTNYASVNCTTLASLPKINLNKILYKIKK
jgi:hypothetical protein